MLAKQLSFLANADSAGLVLGARVPIILTSRADSVRSRIASCAVAMIGRACARRAGAATATAVTTEAEAAMDDYIVVVNAGSSSLKFCIYRRPEADRVAARLARTDRRDRHVAAVRREGRRGRQARRHRRSTPTVVRDGRSALDALARLAALDLQRRPRPGRRAPRRPRRPALCRADGRHAAGPRRAAGADPARPAASAAQPRGDRRRRPRGFPACRRSRASTRASIAASRPSPSSCRCRATSARQGVQRYGFHGLVVRVHRVGAATGSAGDRRRPRRSSRTSAAAPACAR